MMRVSWFLLFLLVMSCGKIEKSRERLAYEKAAALLETGDRPARTQGAMALLDICCRNGETEVGKIARDKLSLLVRDGSQFPVGTLITGTSSPCLNYLSNQITDACSLGCAGEDRSTLLVALSIVEPTPRIVNSIVRQLEASFDPTQPGFTADSSERDELMRTPQEQVRGTAIETIGSLGEDELLLLAPILAAHQNPRMREIIALGFERALENGRVEAPELLATLRKAEDDLDATVADVARRTADRYEAQKDDPENAVERVTGPLAIKYGAIRMLAVRRFSCRAANADGALASYVEQDASLRPLVTEARALRRRRCAALTARSK